MGESVLDLQNRIKGSEYDFLREDEHLGEIGRAHV